MHNVVQVVQAVKTRVCSSVLSHSWISPEKMPFVVEERGKENVVPTRLLRLVCSISVALLTVLPMYSTRVTATGGSVLLESCALTTLCSPDSCSPNIAGKSQIGSPARQQVVSVRK